MYRPRHLFTGIFLFLILFSLLRLHTNAAIVPAGNKGYCNVTITGSNNSVTISGSISSQYTRSPYNYIFGKLFIDGVELKDFTYQTSIGRQTISLSNIRNIQTGYHTAFLQVYNKETGKLVDLLYKTHIAYNGINSQPTYKGRFDVYQKYFYYYPYNMALANQQGKLYMEYKKAGSKTWKRTGYMTANAIKLYTSQNYTISGLKPNTKYNIRIRYGDYVTYDTGIYGDGKSYFFGGPVLKCGTIKTGKAKAPNIKSINVKAVNVRYHKIRHYGAYTGVYLYTEKFYTCRFKVTVRLKQKPGAKGLWINGKYVKGNKKVYSTVFSPYPNYYVKKPPRGLKKYSVSICSYQNKSYGGFSRLRTKKVKIK